MPKSRSLMLASCLMIASSMLLMQLNTAQPRKSVSFNSAVRVRANPVIVDLDKDSLSTPSARVAAATDQDTDQDGLNDWLEVNVYGTDFQKPDSDKDGHGDGVEVNKGYNPVGDGKLVLTAQQKEKIRLAGTETVKNSVAQAQAQDTAIVKLTNSKDIYLRTGDTVQRIANPATLNKLNSSVGVVETKNNLAGLTVNGVVNTGVATQLNNELNLTPYPIQFLTVSLSSSTPPSSTLPDGTIYNPMFTLRLRAMGGPVSVIGLTVQKEFVQLQSTSSSSTSPQQTVIDGVSVWDSQGRRHGAVVLPGSNGLATILFTGNPIVVPSNREITVIIKGDIHWNTTPDQLYAVRLALNNATHVMLASGRVRGSFPIKSNGFSWIDGSSSVANVSVSGLAVNGYNIQPTSTTSTPANILIGGSVQELMKFRISENSSREDVYLTQIKVAVEGNATDNALSNWELWSASSTIATSSAVQGGIVTFNVPNHLISNGQARDFIVKARAVNGVGRWFRLKIQDWHDILVRGASSGAFIHVNASIPWQPITSSNGYWLIGNNSSIGSLNLSSLPVGGYLMAPTSSTNPNILINGQATTNLASFRLAEMSTHEDVLVNQIRMTMEGTVNPDTDLRNFTLTVGTYPVAFVEHASGNQVNFNLLNGAGWTIPAGFQGIELTVTAEVTGGAGHWFRLTINNSNDVVAYGETTGVRVYPTASSWPVVSPNGYWVIGQAPTNAPVQAMISPRWGSSTWAPAGTTQFPVAAYIITNPSPIAVNVSQISLGFMNATSVTSTLRNLSLFNYTNTSTTSTISQVIAWPQNLNTFNLVTPITIAQGASWEFEARGDIPSNAPQGYAFTSYLPVGGVVASDSNNQNHNGPVNQVAGHNFSVIGN